MLVRIMFLWLALALGGGEAWARRVALVIGNGQYAAAGALANPVNDAEDIAHKLRAIGFTVVDGYDLGKRQMEQKIGEFADALEDAEAGLFYFAGHGIQVNERNFILPTDARLDIPAKLRLEAVQVDDIIELMTQQVPAAIAILDACRNNPFARALGGKAKTRGVAVAEGLAQIDSLRGTFIAFSTAPRAVAMDGSGRNSPFAAALLHHMGAPGQSINDMMIAVRREVLKETHDFQTPMSWDTLTARFEFVPAGAAANAPATLLGTPPDQEVIEASASPDLILPEDVEIGTGVETAEVAPEAVDHRSVSAFLRQSYLVPDPRSIAEDVERMYLDQVVSYGQVYSKERLLKAKTSWFKKYRSWKLTLVEGSLTLDAGDGGRVFAKFFIDYVYERKAGKPLSGRSGVRLELVPQDDGSWKVASEQKFP
jgi:hypothetical protein